MTKTIKHEPMRIAGKKVDAEKNINVHYPYTNEITVSYTHLTLPTILLV